MKGIIDHLGRNGAMDMDSISQGSKKVPSSCQGQVDFPVGQVTFHSHLPNGQGPRQVICQLNGNLRVT